MITKNITWKQELRKVSMKVFSTKEIREIDSFTVQHEPVSSVDLMERAALGCAAWIINHLNQKTPLRIFTGPGNNGGDGWAVARILSDKGFGDIILYPLSITDTLSPDSLVNRERLIQQGKVAIHEIRTTDELPVIYPDCVVLDALFGSGLSRPSEGFSCEIIQHINRSGAKVISIDIPSGLFGEDNRANGTCIIHASHTLTFEFPKRAFFFAENEIYTGRWEIIPIGLHKDIIRDKPSQWFYTRDEDLRGILRKRKIFSHKGIQGHALLVAGSYGMIGAAILASRACMRTGTGLVTCHVPRQGYPVIQTAVPESIFSIDADEMYFSMIPPLEKYSAIGAGPGIGTNKVTVAALAELINTCSKPMILDADALNIVASESWIGRLPENTIITPHPGEFDRLTGKSQSGFERNEKQIELSIKHRIIIVLKGAYSSVSLPDGRCFYNSTGNPAMATAGAGDVLTGVILSLLAQGYKPEDAAIAGTFLHGMAGDIAVSTRGSETIIASDIVEHLGRALKYILKDEKF
jgi:NAD(P)H-hydrate epimerase